MPGGTRVPWLYYYLRGIIPRVEVELARLTEQARLIDDGELRTQALSSLKNKAFHCYGGSVLALLAPRSRWPDLIVLITAFQTISDYLDNLCDRVGITDQQAFYRLHESMFAQPNRTEWLITMTYGGMREEEYLSYLVRRCQSIITSLRY